jgi:MOSC domain-containing protein YiiM
MRLISVHCGLPREVDWHGRTVTTSIFKEPVSGRIPLRTLNLDGDRQSDLTVHGGPYKAVYCYPIEHYSYWKAELPGRDLPMGSFGENFTIEGVGDEDSVFIDDRFAIGSAEVVVTQPRLPCFKLGIKFGSDEMVKRFLASRRTGFYLAVTLEGEVGAGDEIVRLSHNADSLSISAITRLYIAKEYGSEDVQLVERAMKVKALPDSWKEWLGERVSRQKSDRG